MLKKYLALALLLVLTINAQLTVNAQTTPAVSQTVNQTALLEKVKRGVAKVGTGEDARVTVTLRDKTKLKGFISQATDNNFSVTDRKTGNVVTVPYADVAKINGKNLSTAAKIAIGAGIGAGVGLLILYALFTAALRT